MTTLFQFLTATPDQPFAAGSNEGAAPSGPSATDQHAPNDIAEGFTDFTRLLEGTAATLDTPLPQAPVEQPATSLLHFPNFVDEAVPVALPEGLSLEASINTATTAQGADFASLLAIDPARPDITINTQEVLPGTVNINQASAPALQASLAPGATPKLAQSALAPNTAAPLTSTPGQPPSLSSPASPAANTLADPAVAGSAAINAQSPLGVQASAEALDAAAPEAPALRDNARPTPTPVATTATTPATDNIGQAELAAQQALKSNATPSINAASDGAPTLSLPPAPDAPTLQNIALTAENGRVPQAAPQNTTAAITAAAPTTNSPAVQQVANAIASANLRSDRLEIRLDPPDLGRVYIDFNLEGDRIVSATLSAEQQDTASLMRRHSDILLRELSNAGFSDVALSFNDAARENMGDTEERQAMFGRAEGQSQSEETSPAPLSPPPSGIPNGRLDLRL